ncbi:unnamed protein product, partial [Rotaria sordida]
MSLSIAIGIHGFSFCPSCHLPIVCHHRHQMYHQSSTCSLSYATFSRLLLLSRGVTTTSTSDSSQSTSFPPPSLTVMPE